jgi:FMN phosphatase YigB (HAD superfamily)
MATVYFDLDGTLYDLYGQHGWLDMLHAEDVAAYINGGVLHNLNDLHLVIDALVAKGYRIGVVSWTAKDGSKAYNAAVRKVKREWVRKYLPQATEVHVVKYGTPKHWVAKDRHYAIIVDDAAEVREAWTLGKAIDATQGMLYELWSIVSDPCATV